MRELAGSGKIKIVEPRQPETKRSRAQQNRPHAALVGIEHTNAIVRADHRRDACRVESASPRFVVHRAPVVDCNRKVVGEGVGGGKAKIDDSGDSLTVEKNVIAEEVAMDRAPRKLHLCEARLEPYFRRQESILLRCEERAHRTRGLARPAGTASVGEPG